MFTLIFVYKKLEIEMSAERAMSTIHGKEACRGGRSEHKLSLPVSTRSQMPKVISSLLIKVIIFKRVN